MAAAIVIKQISQWIGTPVTLECSPQHVVDCTWLFNEKSINIANRYQYSLSDSDGLNTTKCTLLINLFHEEDIGNWTCWSMSTDARDGHLMETYELKISKLMATQCVILNHLVFNKSLTGDNPFFFLQRLNKVMDFYLRIHVT